MMNWPRDRVGRATLTAVWLASVAVGCGTDGPPRYDVAGTVTFDGQPVPLGRIQFLPDSSAGNSGPGGYAMIRDGVYDTRVDGQGASPGPQIVQINGFDGDSPSNDLPDGRPLFRRYETKADVPSQATTLDFDVPASAK